MKKASIMVRLVVFPNLLGRVNRKTPLSLDSRMSFIRRVLSTYYLFLLRFSLKDNPPASICFMTRALDYILIIQSHSEVCRPVDVSAVSRRCQESAGMMIAEYSFG